MGVVHVYVEYDPAKSTNRYDLGMRRLVHTIELEHFRTMAATVSVPAPDQETEAPAPAPETEAPAPAPETEAPAPNEAEDGDDRETEAPAPAPEEDEGGDDLETEAPAPDEDTSDSTSGEESER